MIDFMLQCTPIIIIYRYSTGQKPILFEQNILFLQLMIHTPEDFPDISNSYKIYSEINQSLGISVGVSHIRAGQSLRKTDEKNRKCFLYERRSLKEENLPSYRSNAEDNCYSRCRLKTTYKICNCIPYYFNVKSK